MIFKKFKDLIFIEKVLCKSGIKCPKIQEIPVIQEIQENPSAWELTYQ